LEVKRLFPRAHVIHGPAQFVSEHSERFGLAVLVFEFGKILFPRLTLANEEDGRFGKRPASVHGADLFARRAQFFATGYFGACHQPTRGDKIRHAGKARDVLDLIEEDQRQNLPDPRDGLEPRKGLHLMSFGPAGEIEFNLPE
jgi:hypothetical protein